MPQVLIEETDEIQMPQVVKKQWIHALSQPDVEKDVVRSYNSTDVNRIQNNVEQTFSLSVTKIFSFCLKALMDAVDADHP